MENNLSKLLVGLSVQISRSDGRVHAAIVKSVDTDRLSVMVEWNERKICRGKELNLSELCTLNPELQDLVNSISNRIASPPSAVPAEKRYEGRLRSSRIPALPLSSAPTVNVAQETDSRMQTRQTCLFQPAAAAPESALARPETIQPEESASCVLRNSDVPNKQRRNKEVKVASSLPSVSETVKENEAERVQHFSATIGRRKSLALPEINKASKRLSSVAKPVELQIKKGKLTEASRPNQKIYEMIQDFRETLEMAPLTAADQSETQRICVCVRKRPFNKQELNKREIDVISVPGNGSLLVHEPKQKLDLTKFLENHTFQFDYSFDETVSNDMVYKCTAKPLVQSIFEGSMATCFAYGQTGSGKTHTMGGDFNGKQQTSAKGVYGLAAQDVFTLLNHRMYAHLKVLPYISFFEIYNGKVYDLLNKKAKLRVLEDERQQVQVVGLEEVHVSNADEVIKLIQLGSTYRTSGQTSANANSSRSHAILQIALRRGDRAKTLHGKFSLVDLAGNERGTDVSSNDRGTLVETAEINRSLLALKECIRSLGMNNDHVPFRMSTLTKVLRDSFIGENSKTCMIAMVSPGMASCEYTMNTLRYADRVKELKGPSKGNGPPKAQEFQTLSSSEEESDMDHSVCDAMSQVTQMEVVYTELLRGYDLSKKMMEDNFDGEKSLPILKDYTMKLTEAIMDLEAAVDRERIARMHR